MCNKHVLTIWDEESTSHAEWEEIEINKHSSVVLIIFSLNQANDEIKRNTSTTTTEAVFRFK